MTLRYTTFMTVALLTIILLIVGSLPYTNFLIDSAMTGSLHDLSMLDVVLFSLPAIFCLMHAAFSHGWKNAGIFILIASFVFGLAEYIGIINGTVFNGSFITMITSMEIAGISVFAICIWFCVSYLSYICAQDILRFGPFLRRKKLPDTFTFILLYSIFITTISTSADLLLHHTEVLQLDASLPQHAVRHFWWITLGLIVIEIYLRSRHVDYVRNTPASTSITVHLLIIIVMLYSAAKYTQHQHLFSSIVVLLAVIPHLYGMSHIFTHARKKHKVYTDAQQIPTSLFY